MENETKDKFGNVLYDTVEEVASKLVANEQGTCPICGSGDIDYDSFELDSECGYYPCTCNKCGATWNEWYHLSFTVNDNIRE